jgi:hypothetical protein
MAIKAVFMIKIGFSFRNYASVEKDLPEIMCFGGCLPYIALSLNSLFKQNNNNNSAESLYGQQKRLSGFFFYKMI